MKMEMDTIMDIINDNIHQPRCRQSYSDKWDSIIIIINFEQDRMSSVSIKVFYELILFI